MDMHATYSYALTSISNLMFRSKVDSMLLELGITPLRVKSVESVGSLFESRSIVIAIVDLTRSDLNSNELITELRGAQANFEGPILCYGPHVREDLFAEAKRAGATEVVPNSVISARGAKLITQLLSPA